LQSGDQDDGQIVHDDYGADHDGTDCKPSGLEYPAVENEDRDFG
jgi:hypothetical protein